MSDALRAIEIKLAAARTRLILDKPFLGALVLRLPMRAADPLWCRTTATDARAFYFNPDYIAGLTLDQTQFVLAHEALHCALSHFARRRHRVRHKWDLACDHAVNPLLLEDGLIPPPGVLLKPAYKGLTAEEIYPLIEDDDRSETLDRHAYDRGSASDLDERDPDRQRSESGGQGRGGESSASRSEPGGGSGEPRPLSPTERETLAVQWQQRLAGAAQQAMQAGRLGGELKRLVDRLLQPQLPWRMLLARYLTSLARDDYSYSRPSRREGDFILPRLRSQQADLAVAIDTSGSIKDGEMRELIDEIDALKGQVRARIALLPCDAELCEGAPFRFEPWEPFVRPRELKGGGGTSFVPVFRSSGGSRIRACSRIC